MESKAALVQTLAADIDNAQKKTNECMADLQAFTSDTGVYNEATGTTRQNSLLHPVCVCARARACVCMSLFSLD